MNQGMWSRLLDRWLWPTKLGRWWLNRRWQRELCMGCGNPKDEGYHGGFERGGCV